jgi:hypothetical protein
MLDDGRAAHRILGESAREGEEGMSDAQNESKCMGIVKEWERDLFAAGWKCYSRGMGIWQRPDGALFRGPHKAWHIMTGIPMEEQAMTSLEKLAEKLAAHFITKPNVCSWCQANMIRKPSGAYECMKCGALQFMPTKNEAMQFIVAELQAALAEQEEREKKLVEALHEIEEFGKNGIVLEEHNIAEAALHSYKQGAQKDSGPAPGAPDSRF